MRRACFYLTLVLILTPALAAQKRDKDPTAGFPQDPLNARVYVTSISGGEFNVRTYPEDQTEIGMAQEALRKSGRYTLVYKPEDADHILVVRAGRELGAAGRMTVVPMGEWEQRNRKIAALREELQRNPASLDLASRYWRALAGDNAKGEADYRSGRDVVEAYRQAALLSKDGVEAFARAYQELSHISGEIPRLALFDEPLILSLKTKLPELTLTNRKNVEWILHSIGKSDEERQ